MSAATLREIRRWAQSLGLPVADMGGIPGPVLDRWDREHPGRPAPRPRKHNYGLAVPDQERGRVGARAVRGGTR